MPKADEMHCHYGSSKWTSRKLWFAIVLEFLLAALLVFGQITQDLWLKGTVSIAALYLAGQGVEDASKRFRPFRR